MSTIALWLAATAPDENAFHDSRGWPEARGDRAVNADGADDVIVGQIRAGDVTAYEQLFTTHYASLVHFSTSYVASREVAEELVADLFATIWDQRAEWSPGGITGYLYRAVRNRSLNAMRDHRRRAAYHETIAAAGHDALSGQRLTPEDSLDADERIQLIRTALARLSERQRTILVLRWEHELPWDAIASTLALSVPAAQTDHTRALRALRAYLPADLR